MALTPEEIAAILGRNTTSPADREAAAAAEAGFGTGPEAIAAWRTWSQTQNNLAIEQARAALARSQASGGSDAGNLAARLAELEQRRQEFQTGNTQWAEQFGADKAKFDTSVSGRDALGNPTLAGRAQALDEATFEFNKAKDARDFGAMEYWRARGQELEQNRLTRDVTNDLYASKRNPQDWVDYWYRSRGMTPPAGAKSVPVEDAIPAWARAFSPGTYPDSRGQGGYPGGATSFPASGGAGGPSAAGARQSGVLNLPASKVGAPVTSQPAWLSAAGPGNRTAGPVGYNGGMFEKGTVLGAGDKGVPISLSDWTVKNLKGPAWSVGGAAA